MEPLSSGRRDYDRDIDPNIQLFVEEAVRDTRHALRNEVSALGAEVANNTATSTKEHATVLASLAALTVEVAALKPLVANVQSKVQQFETAQQVEQGVADATSALRKDLRRFVFALAGLIVAASGVIVAVIH